MKNSGWIALIFALALGAYIIGQTYKSKSSNVSDSTKEVTLFYYNSAKDIKDNNIQCSRQGLVGVKRKVPQSAELKNVIDLLLKGELTSEERADGLTTELPLPNLTLEQTRLDSNQVTLTFSDPNNQTSGGACRVTILWAQIEATAQSYTNINNIRFQPESLFQP